jgi:hypothetical protein
MDFARMRPLQARHLTSGEATLAREVFGPGLDLARVRIVALPVWGRAFVPNGWLMAWPAAEAPCDFSAPSVPLAFTGAFIHEMTHVWQAQNGVNLILAKLKAGDDAAAYAYDLTGQCDFSYLNIEQQAMVVQHAFLASRGGEAPYASEAYAAILTAWPGRVGDRPWQV